MTEEEWFNSENFKALRETIHNPVFLSAINIAKDKNASRFNSASNPTSDKIIAQASYFDQMKGWSDCIKYLFYLSTLPEKKVNQPVMVGMSDEAIRETAKRVYNKDI